MCFKQFYWAQILKYYSALNFYLRSLIAGQELMEYGILFIKFN